MWIAHQYRGVWDGLYAQCDEDTQIMLDARLDILKEKGNQARRPVSAYLDKRIFELRAKRARMLFYFGQIGSWPAVIFVHALFKDGPKIPREDIELAARRKNEITKSRARTDALPN